MVNIWTIAKREYNLYFSSPVAYMVAFVVYLVLGIFFFLNLQIAATQQGYVPGPEITMGPLATMLVLITPAITTRLLAEERRLGTIELLLTAPVRDSELVVGKWLGSFLLMFTIIAITLVYPLLLNQLVKPGIDQGPLLSGYLGLILLSASMIAVGVFISSLFSNQIAAFVTTLGVLIFLWWVLSPIAQVTGPLGSHSDLVNYLDYSGHFFDTLMRGIIDLKDVVFYLSVTALALFFGTMSIEIRRWG
ncbi:MAG: ABC transporter permease [Anaerolineales bacterium]|jgi:ABC-2 type transport system permease protein|nr:ABC transporter permease [Anaerolineales bacterium]